VRAGSCFATLRHQWRPLRLLDRTPIAPGPSGPTSNGSARSSADAVAKPTMTRALSSGIFLRTENAAPAIQQHPMLRALRLIPVGHGAHAERSASGDGPLARSTDAASASVSTNASTSVVLSPAALRSLWVPVAPVLVDWLVAETQLARSLYPLGFLWSLPTAPPHVAAAASDDAMADLSPLALPLLAPWSQVRCLGATAAGTGPD